VTFVAKIRVAGGRCLEIPSLFEWMGEEHPYPFRSQMAKGELERHVLKPIGRVDERAVQGFLCFPRH
jgi:hypothetical protein